jgi:hypothetical protein
MLYGLQRGVPPAVREVAPDGPVPEDVFLRCPSDDLATGWGGLLATTARP